MSKRPMTVELDGALVEPARAEARQTGRSESEVVEDVLRQHFETLNRSVTDDLWSRNAAEELTGDEALTLAYDELQAIRRECREADKAAS